MCRDEVAGSPARRDCVVCCIVHVSGARVHSVSVTHSASLSLMLLLAEVTQLQERAV